MKKRLHFQLLLFAAIAAQLTFSALRSSAQVTASASPSPLCKGQTAILQATPSSSGSPYMAIPIPTPNKQSYTLSGSMAPRGTVYYLSNNVPFLVPNNSGSLFDSWSSAVTSTGGTATGTDSLDIPLDCPPYVDTLYTLINTYWGDVSPSLISLKLTFVSSSGSLVPVTIPLVGDQTVRDYYNNCYTNSLSAGWVSAGSASIATQQVWASGTSGLYYRRDLQRIVIPAPYNTSLYRLKDIRLIDRGNLSTGCGDPGQRVFIAGASVHLSPVIATPSITWHSGSLTGPIVGTGTTIGVSPTSTTTYYAVADSGCFAQVNLPVQVCCVDDCYWKVTGNTILNGNNIFGTMSNDNVNIYTNSAPVGIITKTGKFGFGGVTPGNTVEITQGTAGNSGLRFTNMNNSSAAVANPGNKVLSVDGSGDVVLVNGASGGAVTANNGVSIGLSGDIQLGQDCSGGTGADLTSNRVIPMHDNNIEFADGSLANPGSNRIGIGTSGCSPQAKLDVIRNVETIIYDPTNIAISGTNKDNAQNTAIGVYGEANSEQNPINIGGDFLGQNNSQRTFGVRGIAQSQNGIDAYGGWFSACGAQRNIGVFASACNAGSGGPSFAAEFAGDALINGMYYPSDKRVKQNIEPIVDALAILQKIQPKTYQFNTAVYPGLNLPANTLQYGVISQELEQVLPSLVKEAPIPDGNKGFLKETIKAVNYTELIPILIQAVKDQQQQIDALNATIAGQKATDSKTSATQSGYLAQNVPNPFSISTVIKYELPVGAQKASIGVYDMNGKELRLFPLSTEKTGSVTIQANELMPGMYLYSLIVDGNYFDSKKMILTSQ